MQRIRHQPTDRPVRRGGFTLIEILIVIAIILVIAAMAVPQLMGRQRAAMVSATQVTVKSVEKAVKFYAADHDGEYPQGEGNEIWDTLMNVSEYRGRQFEPYLEELPVDAWGETLNYRYDSKDPKPLIWSNGPNHTDDGASEDSDDISNRPRTSNG